MKIRSTINRVTDVGKYNIFIRRNQAHHIFTINTRLNKANIYKGTFPVYSPIQSTDMDLITYLKSAKSKWPYEGKDNDDTD